MRIQSMPIVPAYQPIANNKHSNNQNNILKQNNISFGDYPCHESWYSKNENIIAGCAVSVVLALIVAIIIAGYNKSEQESEEERADINAKFRIMLNNAYTDPKSDGGINITENEIAEREQIINLFDSITKGVSLYDYDKERLRINSVRDQVISNITDSTSEEGSQISDSEKKRFLKELQIALEENKKEKK